MTPEDEAELVRLEERIAELKSRANAPPSPTAGQDDSIAPQPLGTKRSVPKSKNNVLGWVLGSIVAFIAFVWLIGTLSQPPVDGPGATEPVSTVTAADMIETPPEDIPQVTTTAWQYTQTTDPMSDATDELACVTSRNEVQLNWPYSPVNANLCVRKTKRWGTDVYINLNGDGQMLCNSYDGCQVKVRFGQAEARNFRGTGADDNSSNIVFISDGSTSSFISRLKDADITRIELSYYEAGNQVLEFPTKELEWPRPVS